MPILDDEQEEQLVNEVNELFVDLDGLYLAGAVCFLQECVLVECSFANVAHSQLNCIAQSGPDTVTGFNTLIEVLLKDDRVFAAFCKPGSVKQSEEDNEF